MPDNDFTDYMGLPPQGQWASTEPQNTGRSGPPQFWGGMTPRTQQLSWGGVGGRYAGNAGALAGGLADAYAPMSSMGIWAAEVGQMQNPIRYGQHRYNKGNADALMERSAESMKGRIVKVLEAQQVEGTPDQLRGAAELMAASPQIRGLMGGGDLTETGAGALVGAVAGQHNGWKPSKREVTTLHGAFENYYGFDRDGSVDYARTMGRSQDELAVITSEVRQRMDPELLHRERRAAEREFKDYMDTGVGAELEKIGVSKADWDAARSKGGSNEEIAKRLGKTELELRTAGADAWAAKGLTGEVSEEALLQNKLMGKNRSAMKTLSSYEAAGFEGDMSQLFNNLEKKFKGESLDPMKMEALAERIRGVTEATGMTLESIESLIQTAQKGTTGIDIGVDQASGVIAAATMFGGGAGVTNQQRRAIQADAAQAIGDPSKSPAAVAAGLLQQSGDPRYAEYQRLMASGTPEGRQQARDLLNDAIYVNKPKGVEAGMDALATGDVEIANKQLQDKLERGKQQALRYNELMAAGAGKDQATILAQGKKDAEEYNKLVDSGADKSREAVLKKALEDKGAVIGKDGKASISEKAYGANAGEMAALKEDLVKRGATFNKDGTATTGDRTFDNLNQAAGEAWDNLAPEIRDNLLKVGERLVGSDASEEHKRIAGSRLAADSQQLGSPAKAIAATKASLHKVGIKVQDDVNVSDINEAYAVQRQLKSMGAVGHAYVNTIGHSGLNAEQFAAYEKTAQRAGRISEIGGMSDILKRGLAGGEGGKKILISALGGKNADPALEAVVGGVLGAKEDDREELLASLADFGESSADMLRFDPNDEHSADEHRKAKERRQKAVTTLTSKAKIQEDDLNKLEEAANNNKVGDFTSSARGSGLGKLGTDYMKMTGTLTVKMQDPTGKTLVEAPGELSGQSEGGNNTGSDGGTK